MFIGLLWLRFGMPPGRNRAGVDHDSGTEEEFRLAYRAWQETRRPRILFYRCTRPAPVSVDTKQLRKVQRFFEEFAPKGENPGLFEDFGEADQFEKMVEKHLTGLLIEEYQASSLPPRMRADVASSSRGKEAQTFPSRQANSGEVIAKATAFLAEHDNRWYLDFAKHFYPEVTQAVTALLKASSFEEFAKLAGAKIEVASPLDVVKSRLDREGFTSRHETFCAVSLAGQEMVSKPKSIHGVHRSGAVLMCPTARRTFDQIHQELLAKSMS